MKTVCKKFKISGKLQRLLTEAQITNKLPQLKIKLAANTRFLTWYVTGVRFLECKEAIKIVMGQTQ